MSSTTTQTVYSFTLTTSSTSGPYDQVTWNAYNNNGMSDALANDIYQALKGVTPPAGSSLSITVSKQDTSDTGYATTYGNPITFA